jgi:hypothetical protein
VLPVWKKIADIASKTRHVTKTDREGNQLSQALTPRTDAAAVSFAPA